MDYGMTEEAEEAAVKRHVIIKSQCRLDRNIPHACRVIILIKTGTYFFSSRVSSIIQVYLRSFNGIRILRIVNRYIIRLIYLYTGLNTTG